MRIKKDMKIRILLGLLVMVILTFAAFPGGAMADICSNFPVSSTDYTSDTDGDGIPDYYECNGFNLYDNSHVCGYNEVNNSASPCYPNRSNRTQYVDPATSDLFVILVLPTSGSLISGIPNLLEYINKAPVAGSGGGLGITTHTITPAQIVPNTDRQISTSFTQKAVRSAEQSTDTTGTTVNCKNISSVAAVLGVTSTTGGNPNTTGLSSTVYSNRVKTFITNLCACGTYCYDYASGFGKNPNNSNTTLQDLINLYQKQNISHEIGHMMTLTPDNETIYHHYLSSQSYTPSSGGAGSLMEQAAFYKSTTSGKTTTIMLYIPTFFDAGDPTNMHLK